MTTEGEIIEFQRDVNVLLLMDSYQDMTDAEIESIIEFKMGMAHDAGYHQAMEDARLVAENQLLNAQIAKVQAATDVLQSMLEKEMPWVSVGSDS